MNVRHTWVWVGALAMVSVLGETTAAQTIRWNDRGAASDLQSDAPRVQVWLQGSRAYSYGAPVRVMFNVSEDAYVVVGRVDANGHLTVLYPDNRRRSSEARGGMDILVRGRGVPGATFAATDRMGGGFVFAVASFEPFDLSRLTVRDFDRYVTGTYVGRPTTMYVGNPHRVVSRFAEMVSYREGAPYDYAVDYYGVELPGLASSSYANSCGAYSTRFTSLAERWDDEFYYGTRASRYNVAGCNDYCGIGSMLAYYTTYGAFADADCRYNLGRGQVVQGPPVVPPPLTDSSKVPGWVGDSVRAHGPDTVSNVPNRDPNVRSGNGPDVGRLGKITTVNEGPRQPIMAGDDPADKSYAIPERALRTSRLTLEERRDGMDMRGVRADPPRSETGGARQDVTWVRPPREVYEGPRGSDGAAEPPRRANRGADGRSDVGDRRSGGSSDGEFRPPAREAPPRSGGRFDSPPPSTRDYPESRAEPRVERPSPPPSPRSEPVRAAEPPRPAPTPVREPPAEKKPEKPHQR
ncbi:MAG: DUF4384 domain-containing protein [Gemmatimonadaceae bacterium]